MMENLKAEMGFFFHRVFLGAHRYTTEGGISVRPSETIAWSLACHKGRNMCFTTTEREVEL